MPYVEDEVRAALADLAGDQPEQPHDRAFAVRRRHIRRRTVQGAAAVAAAAIAVAGTLFGVGAIGGTHASPQPAGPGPTPVEEQADWQLPWPARAPLDVTPGELAAVRGSALAAFQLSQGVSLTDVEPNPHPVNDLRILYAGKPDGMDVTWLVFEARWGGPAEHHLVGMASPTGAGDWTTYVGTAPPPDTTGIGFAWADGSHGGQIFALGSPDVQYVGYVDLFSGDTSLVDVNTPYILGTAVLKVDHPMTPDTLFIGQADFRTNYPVLFPEGTPHERRLAWQAPPSLPASVKSLGSVTGAGDINHVGLSAPVGGVVRVGIRCAGPAPVTVTVTAESGATARTVQRRCDGSIDDVSGGSLTASPGEQLSATVDADASTLYAITFVAAAQ